MNRALQIAASMVPVILFATVAGLIALNTYTWLKFAATVLGSG